MDRRIYRRFAGLARAAWFAVLLIAVVNVCLPFTTGKLPSGHDTQRYIPRLVEFHENIRHGNLIPRWAPDLIRGQGQPLFVFSPPLPYYIAEPWRLAGLDAVASFNWASITMVLLSAASMFLLCSLYFGEKGGILGAIAYIYSPYFHVDLYVRGAYSEFTAMAIYPLALYAWARYSIEKDARVLALGAVAFAGVTLSHNPTALMFAPLIAGFAIFQAVAQRSWKTAAWQLGALATALALTGYFWLPALFEISNVHGERLLGGYFDYRGHFVELRQFVSSFWGYGGSVPGPDDQMSLSLGWTHVLLGVIALAASRWMAAPGRGVVMFFAAAFVAFCGLMLPFSAIIWQAVPLLQYEQFPWRLLGPASVALAFVIASLSSFLQAETVTKNALGAGLALLLLAPNWYHATPRAYSELKAEDWTPEALARRGVETTAMREFETRWVERVLPYTPDRFRIVSGEASVEIAGVSPTFWSAAVVANHPSEIEARLLYFPGWTVSVDGIDVPAAIAPQTGRIRFNVDAGRRDVRLELRPTRLDMMGRALSVAGLLSLLVFLRRLGRLFPI